jgi:ribosomal protein S15P/S13E
MASVLLKAISARSLSAMPRAVPRLALAPRSWAQALSTQSAPAPSAELASGNYLWGITDEQIATLGESVRRAVSLENASNSERMKVELQRALQYWQARPGDTGSPAVQSTRDRARALHRARHRALGRPVLGTRARLRRARVLTRDPRPPRCVAAVAIMTVRIEYLSRHLVSHHKDKASKRTMSLLIGHVSGLPMTGCARACARFKRPR